MEKIQNGMTSCKCGNTLRTKEFTYYIVEYCDNCHYYDVINKQCPHENNYKIPIKFKIANGSFQIRLYCPECKMLDSKSQKQSNYDLSKLKEKTLESFEVYKQQVINEEKNSFDEFINTLRSNKIETIRDIYLRYIKSDAWKDKRFKVLRRDSNICQICGKKAMDVHHLTYAHLQSEYLFELVSLCRDCHIKYYHLDKLDFDVSNTQFDNETPF